jgi:hypothetical protein
MKREHWQYYLAAEGAVCPRFAKNTYVNLGRGGEYPIEYKHMEAWCRRGMLISL